jgi:NCAIR mutase (PurE)-related protein
VLAPTAYEARLADLLARVSSGEVSPGDAARELRDLPFSDLGFAKVDHHRELRQGACEIVYAEGKTPEEVRAIVERLLTGNEGPILVSRTSRGHVDAVRAAAAGTAVEIVERPRARCIALRRATPPAAGTVLIMTAGTSDLGGRGGGRAHRVVARCRDRDRRGRRRRGSASPGRRATDARYRRRGRGGRGDGGGARERRRRDRACPVIACPTSVGYGASLGGLAALLSMLSSCAPGVACVNVDDGVGAGTIAAMIARQSVRR